MPDQPRVDESFVAAVWERQAYDPSLLGAIGLRTVFRGVPSDAGGPDYQDAMFSVAGRSLLRGDVEFHVRSSDWYRHGHDGNRQYNNVVLHVVWIADTAVTRRQDGVPVPILALEGDPSVQGHTGPTSASLLPHPCVAAFARLSTDQLAERIRNLGVERFHRRAAVFSADLSAESPDQTAYRALLEGLGYASNRSVFRLLADAVPYGWLMDVPLHRRGAVLLDAAGLGPQATPSPPAHVPREAWRLSRLRPANHPALRLRGLALLLERFQPSLADALVRLVHATERPSELRARLVARDGDTCIGPGRGDELAVSVVLPLVSALEDPADSAERLFLRYPSPPFNRWTRFMLDLAREAGHDGLRVRHADDHQGLHHLYHGHCRRGVSAGCPLCGLTRRAPLAAPEALTQAGHRTLDD